MIESELLRTLEFSVLIDSLINITNEENNMNIFLFYAVVGFIPVLMTTGTLSWKLLGIQLLCLIIGIAQEK